MLDCILIDDEPPALRWLDRLLAAHADNLRIVGRFQRGKEALAEIEGLIAGRHPCPAVAFIDVQMPGLSGLDVAAELRQRLPAIAIVFVTAYRDYAAEAFATEAIDYLLKPVEPARLAQTVGRVLRHCVLTAAPASPVVSVVHIRAFGGLTVTGPGGAVRWHSAKTRELFAYLLQHHRAGFAPEQLLDDLYADSAPERARQRYYDDLYRLRQKFAEAGIVEGLLRIERQRLQFNSAEIDIDVDRFEQLLAPDENQPNEAEALRQALRIAAGSYLQGNDWPWAATRRAQFDGRRQHSQSRLADLDLAAGRRDLAQAGLLQLLELAPYDESAVTRLMRLYLDSGQPAQARHAYERFRQRLLDDLQVESSAALRALVER